MTREPWLGTLGDGKSRREGADGKGAPLGPGSGLLRGGDDATNRPMVGTRYASQSRAKLQPMIVATSRALLPRDV